MNVSQIEKIRNLIHRKIGVHVSGAKNPLEARNGLSFWFENYHRSEGPIFSIRPSGLKRHIITLKFGAYAAPCIEHINKQATPEAYLLAYAFLNQLAKNYAVKLNGSPLDGIWSVSQGFNVEVTLKISEQKDPACIYGSVERVMLPLMAAIAELIGYEEIKEIEVKCDVEGELTESLIKKRERSSRNRLLCLSIHGDQCGVCRADPKTKYGSELGSILEVHHIEPLAEVGTAKAYNPSIDLIPLCPNCHRAIHKRKPAYTPDELKELLDL